MLTLHDLIYIKFEINFLENSCTFRIFTKMVVILAKCIILFLRTLFLIYNVYTYLVFSGIINFRFWKVIFWGDQLIKNSQVFNKNVCAVNVTVGDFTINQFN